MLGLLQNGLQPKPEMFGQLTIDRRVLVTPRSTISVSSIAAVSSGTVGVPRIAIRRLALVLLAAGSVLLIGGVSQKSTFAMAFGGVCLLGGVALTRFAKTEVPCLSVASIGGQVFLFTGRRKALEEARRLLSDKINAADETSAYRIDFEKGIVQSLSHVEPVATIFANPGNHPAPGKRRLGAYEPHLQGPASPRPPLANGHYAGGDGLHVDYTPVLAQIVDMQRFYAQRTDTQDIAERLSEMEYLMRSGTPTVAGRSRLDQLADELSAILSAYPNVVQIFQQAARLAGV